MLRAKCQEGLSMQQYLFCLCISFSPILMSGEFAGALVRPCHCFLAFTELHNSSCSPPCCITCVDLMPINGNDMNKSAIEFNVRLTEYQKKGLKNGNGYTVLFSHSPICLHDRLIKSFTCHSQQTIINEHDTLNFSENFICELAANHVASQVTVSSRC
jgi:hypothetical protein